MESLEERATPAAFVPGNLAVLRIGDGQSTLTNAAFDAYFDEYTTSGTLVQSIALPAADNGANQALTISGTANSEGQLTRSPDGQFLVVTGYDAAPGTADIANSSSASVPRVIGLVKNDGVVNTTTTTTSFSNASIRSAITNNGTDFWAAGGNTGVIHTTIGANGAGTVVSSTQTNNRVVQIFDGQLYVSSGAGTNTTKGVNSVGVGTPTGTGQVMTRLPGLSDTANPSTYGYFFADLDAGGSGVDTLYLADDGNGAFAKYSLVAGTWTLNGTIGTTSDDYRGLTGVVNGTSVTLYAIRDNGSAADTLVTLTDSSGYNGAFSGTPTVIVTAPSATMTAFRSVQFVPLPTNSAPVNTLPSTFTVGEDSTTTLAGISVTDADAGTANIRVTLSVPAGNGSLTVKTDVSGGIAPGDITGGGNGTHLIKITASLSKINATLADAEGLRYSPPSNFNSPADGTVTLTMVTDDLGNTGVGGAKSDTDASKITITEVNDAPIATDDNLSSIAEDSGDRTISFASLLANDDKGASNESAQTLSITAVSNPVGGTAEIVGSDVIFHLTANFNGTASFAYTVADNGTTNGSADLKTSVGSVSFTVTEMNDVPAANDDTLSDINEDSGDRVIPFADLTGNDSAGPTNESGQALTIITVSNPVGGTVEIVGSNVVFHPTPDYSGPAGFDYTLRDNGTTNGSDDFKTDVGSVSFTINSSAEAPQATNATTAEETQSTNGLKITPNPVDGGSVTHFKITGITGGTLYKNDGVTPIANGELITVTAGGDGLKFTPVLNLNTLAGDTFSFIAQAAFDEFGAGLSAGTTVTITVTEINDAPNATDDNLSSIAEDSGDRTIPFASLLTNDDKGPVNESGQALNIISVNNAVGGTAELVGSDVIFRLATNFNGVAGFDYTVQDNGTTNGSTDAKTDVGHVSFNVIPVQDQPILDSGPITTILPVAINSTNPIGTPIANLLVNASDVDAGDTLGIAITMYDNSKGNWQFNLDVDGTGTWQNLPSLPLGSAFLLANDGDTELRFLPKRGFRGFSSVTFMVWDGTTIEGEGQLDSTIAGDSAYSANLERAWVAVGNPKPTIDLDGNTVLIPVREESVASRIVLVRNVLGIAGIENLPKKNLGIAITDASATDGKWQFRPTRTKNWIDVGTVDESTAMLLKPTDQLRFVPNADADGAATLTFKTWDGTGGTSGNKVDPTGSAFSVDDGSAILDVTPELELSAAAVLDAIDAGDTTTPVAFDSFLSPSDIDGGDVGVAITGVRGAMGTWEYSTDGGTTWLGVGRVSAARALFLNANVMIRFTAAGDALPGTASLTYKAWISSTGEAGSRGVANLKNTSRNFDVLTVAVGNTAPTLNVTGVTLPAVKVTAKPGAGFAVSKLLTEGAVVDASKGLKGVAIVGVDNGNGIWQYFAGGVWRDFGTVSQTSAVLLTTANKIRFVPSTGTPAGTQATIQFKAWDGTTGQGGDRIDTTNINLNSFSTAIETGTITVM